MARPRFRWPQTWTLLFLASAALLGGCHKLFGDYEVVGEPSPPTTLCVAGDLRCVGPFLYTCGQDLESWTYVDTCSTEAHCRSRDGGCKPCAPGEHRCEGTKLEVCDESFAWREVEDCLDANACNLNSDSCRPCVENEHQCQGAALMRCSPELTWVLAQQCANPTACSVAPGKLSGSCAPVDPRCTTPQGHVCDGVQLLRCTDAMDRLIPIERCPSAAHCDAATADKQAEAGRLATCLDRCEAGAIRCVDAEFQRCSAEGAWTPEMTCASASACSAKAGSTGCEPCTSGALECNDGELRRCAPKSPGGWETVADCGVARLCNEAAGRCDAGGCSRAGQTRCDLSLERCKPDQSEWDSIDFCEGDLCNAHDAKCDRAACKKDARRCWGSALQQCDKSLRDWETLETCAEGETCTIEGCAPNACTDGEYRCNDVYLEACTGGVWLRKDRCATAALCDATSKSCEPPACEANSSICDEDMTLRRCRPDQTGYDRSDCADAALICDPYAGKCIE